MKAPDRPGSFGLCRRGLGGLLAITCLLAPVRADELRLLDGRVLVGKVTEQGEQLEVSTRDGVVVVAKSQVVDRTRDDVLRQRLAERARAAGDTPFAHLQLAMDARAVGLEAELWQHLDRGTRLQAESGTAASDSLQRRRADFLAQLEPELLPRRHRSAPTKVRVQQLLEALRFDSGPGRAAAIEELLVREANADQDLRAAARSNGSVPRRKLALSALQRRPTAGNPRFVLRTAILDGTEDVRQHALALAKPGTSNDDVAYLATGLAHQQGKVRVRTAEVLGALGNAAAVKLLVLAAPEAGKALAPGGGSGSLRSHIAILQQQAYVRDYDVEVAQAAFIADPKVDVLTTGAVLDVELLGVSEVRTILRSYRRALEQLTRSDPGDDPRRWPTWLADLPTAPPAPAPTTGGR